MKIDELIRANTAWATKRHAETPELFQQLAQGQAPSALWIGCADSRVPPDHIVASEPGTLFVHRNVANVVTTGDLNLMSVLEYATSALRVPHIYVCGHESCGGVAASLDGPPDGVLSHWLSPVQRLARDHAEELDALPDRAARVARLVELNVRAQVTALAQTPQVRSCWDRGQPLAIHGLVFHLSTGRIQDVDCSLDRLPH